MITMYGMSTKLGLLSYSNFDANEQRHKSYSEETLRLIDREARSIVTQQYQRAKTLLKQKAYLVTALSKKLAEKETLIYDDLREILGERPYGLQKEHSRFMTAGANPFAAGHEPDN
eukprot:gnl/MRDRNA2_/MRDRNA2_193009_c0_seq1.p1 gnl/MRDRNA2_/MRDRNA2_193009_c0~~gnl/MRDRNA2_/MRDRNA2_193009_c0_seq1.p1  ORF type:complete len:136 (+),score=24.54 gnl/MRDRNA2_/MRDRNA2_193009_c0_seq1:62-409(+)